MGQLMKGENRARTPPAKEDIRVRVPTAMIARARRAALRKSRTYKNDTALVLDAINRFTEDAMIARA